MMPTPAVDAVEQLQVNLLRASLAHWCVDAAQTDNAHPLDFYVSIQKPNWRTKYEHSEYTARQAIELCLAHWQRPYNLFNTASLLWSLQHFPLSVTVKAINYMSPATNTNLSPDVVSRLTMSLAELESSLLARDPKMPVHLAESQRLLKSYPETVNLLDDDEVARLISAAQVHSQVEIVKAGVARPVGKKKVTADEL